MMHIFADLTVYTINFVSQAIIEMCMHFIIFL